MAHHYSLTRSPSNPSPTLYPLPSAARSHRDPTDPPCHPPGSCSTHPRSCQNATAAGGGGKRAWRWPTAMTTPPTLSTRRLLLLVTVVRDRVVVVVSGRGHGAVGIGVVATTAAHRPRRRHRGHDQSISDCRIEVPWMTHTHTHTHCVLVCSFFAAQVLLLLGLTGTAFGVHMG
jgi:hypothetical protein